MIVQEVEDGEEVVDDDLKFAMGVVAIPRACSGQVQ